MPVCVAKRLVGFAKVGKMKNRSDNIRWYVHLPALKKVDGSFFAKMLQFFVSILGQ